MQKFSDILGLGFWTTCKIPRFSFWMWRWKGISLYRTSLKIVGLNSFFIQFPLCDWWSARVLRDSIGRIEFSFHSQPFFSVMIAQCVQNLVQVGWQHRIGFNDLPATIHISVNSSIIGFCFLTRPKEYDQKIKRFSWSETLLKAFLHSKLMCVENRKKLPPSFCVWKVDH